MEQTIFAYKFLVQSSRYASMNVIFEGSRSAVKACTNSLDCNNSTGEFCNFDLDNWGFCEECKGVADCKNEGFKCENGFDECQRICEGKNILTYV